MSRIPVAHVARMHTMLMRLIADGVTSEQAVEILLTAHEVIRPRTRHTIIAAELSAAGKIVRAVCRSMNVTADDLRSSTRQERVVRARWIAAALMRAVPMSLPQIAREVGLGHYTTVWYGLGKVRGDAELTAAVERLRAELRDVLAEPPAREEAA